MDRRGHVFPITICSRFAKTLRRDLEAVTRSITAPWNNGRVEGHIKPSESDKT
jgi:transposase